jgi:glyoxylase-like metal-dependent hydrolase (beta-lactamase superfamily II)
MRKPSPSTLALLASLAIAAPAKAQRGLPLIMHTIKPGKIYWAEGGGGNSGIVIGDKGVIVIDAKISTEAGHALVEEIAKLTPKPITHVIETHSDGDHVNGIAAFPVGIKIIAHINNKIEQMAVPITATVEIGGGKCLPPQDRLPNMVIYNDKVSTVIDGEPVIFYHVAPAHTNGDLIAYFPTEKLAFTGDIITYNVLIHPEKNGSLDGWFKNARFLLTLNADTYVGGHAKQPDDKASLRKRIADIQASKDKVAALMDQGKSLPDIKAAMGDPPQDSIGCRGTPYPSLTWAEFQDHANRLEELK